MASDDLNALGAVLRQAREMRALSLEEVEAYTRIRSKYLQALETGEISALPSIAHAKGFLRNYAQFLYLDANQLVDWFGQVTGTGARTLTTNTAVSLPPPVLPDQLPDTPPDATVASRNTAPLRRSVYISPAERVGPGMPAGMAPPAPSYSEVPAHSQGPAAAWPGYEQTGPAYPAEEPAKPRRPFSIRANLISGMVLVVGFVAIVWWVTTQLSTIEVSDAAVSTIPALNSVVAATITPIPTAILTSTPANNLPQVLDRVILRLTVTQRSWVKITVDGLDTFEGQVEAGEVVQYEGFESIVVLAGNAAALDVTFNGQNLGIMGARGEVVERWYTVTGDILAPTPTPTVTPTNTPVPTPTSADGR